jgi:hypothetical protein
VLPGGVPVRVAHASGRAAEVDILGLDRPGRPPRRRLVRPVKVRVRGVALLLSNRKGGYNEHALAALVDRPRVVAAVKATALVATACTRPIHVRTRPERVSRFLFRLICGCSNMGGSTIALMCFCDLFVCGDPVNGVDQTPRTL